LTTSFHAGIGLIPWTENSHWRGFYFTWKSRGDRERQNQRCWHCSNLNVCRGLLPGGRLQHHADV